MARLITSGFETQSLTESTASTAEGQGVISKGTVAIDTSVVASGAASASCVPSAANYIRAESLTTVLGRAYFFRAAIWLSSITPSEDLVLVKFGAAGIFGTIYLSKAEEALNLKNLVTETDVAKSGFKPTKESWFYLEMKMMVPAAGEGTVAMVIRDASGVVKYESGDKTQNVGTTAITRIDCGHGTAAESAVTVKVDDFAVNDDQGASQKSWPGYGKAVLLKPISDKSRVGWAAGGGGEPLKFENLWEAVDNTPPVGIATSTHGSQIKDSENNATDTYQANLQTYTAGGIGASDSIKVAMALGRVGNISTVTSRNLGLKGISNPEIAEVTKATGTTKATTDPTGWSTAVTTPAYEPSVTKGESPVVQAKKLTATTDSVCFDLMGLYVEYVPATSYTDSGSGTITLSGTKTTSDATSDSRSGTVILSGSFVQSYTATDSRSGTATLSGSKTESYVHNDSGSGTVTLSGNGVESYAHNDSRSGTVTLSGSKVESYIHNDVGSGIVTLSGSKVESGVYNDSRSGTVTVSGTSSEIGLDSDSRSGTIAISGTKAESASYTDSGAGTIVLSGKVTETGVGMDSGSGTISFSGVGEESWGFSGSAEGTITLSGSGEESLLIVFNDTLGGVITISGSGKDKHGHIRHFQADPPSDLVLESHITTLSFWTNPPVLELDTDNTTLTPHPYTSTLGLDNS